MLIFGLGAARHFPENGQLVHRDFVVSNGFDFQKAVSLLRTGKNVLFRPHPAACTWRIDKPKRFFYGRQASKRLLPHFSGVFARVMLLPRLREEVLEANLELVRRGLVLYTFGNASAISRPDGLIVIKPSGIPYEGMKPSDLVVTDLNGKIVEG